MKSKKKQRLLALILSMVLMLSASISAMAEGEVPTEASGTETTETQAAAQSLGEEAVPETEVAEIDAQTSEISEESVQEATEQETSVPSEETADPVQEAADETAETEMPTTEEITEEEILNAEEQPAETTTTETTAEEQPAETPEEILPEEVISEAAELKQEFTDENGNVTQTVTAYVPEGAFQATADQISMEVSLLDTDDTNYIKGMMEELLPENYYLDGYVLYQIDFKVNGEITQPAKAVTISMTGNDLAVEDIQKAHVFYYDPEDPEVEDDEDQLAEVIQKDQLIKSLEESGESTENIEDYDYSEIAVNEGNADTITIKGWESTIYGCYVEKEAEPVELKGEAEDIQVTLSGPASSFPQEGELALSVKKVDKETKKIVKEAIEEEAENSGQEVVDYTALDITLLHNGEEIQPLGPVNVTFTKQDREKDAEEVKETKVFHVDEEKGTATDMEAAVNTSGEAEIETTHFSVYVVVDLDQLGGQIQLTVQHWATVNQLTGVDGTDGLIESDGPDGVPGNATASLKSEDVFTSIYTDDVLKLDNTLKKNIEELSKVLLASADKENKNYELTEIWFLKDGKQANSTNRADWDIYSSTSETTVRLTKDTTVRLVYKPLSYDSALAQDVTFYDYDVTDGKRYDKNGNEDPNGNYLNTTNQGINSEANYSGGNEWNRLAVGMNSTWVDHSYHNARSKNGNGVLLNWAGDGMADSAKKGIVTGINADGPIYDGVVAPQLFNNTLQVGKTVLHGYQLHFNQVGDTYTLSSVSKKDGEKVLNVLNDLETIREIWDKPGKNRHIFSNNFWPLDTEQHLNQDPLLGGQTHYKVHKVNTNVGDKDTGESDDGEDHNWLFGMRYSFEFTLGDYTGPLNFYFRGDDDFWLFVDGVLRTDLGGIHSSVGANLDLSECIDMNDRTTTHRIEILYMERGCFGSTCYMQFTIPNVKPVEFEPEVEKTTVTVEKNWEDFNNPNRPASIQVQLLYKKANSSEEWKIYDTQTLNQANSWKYTWSGLPKYGYSYKVKEVGEENGQNGKYKVTYESGDQTDGTLSPGENDSFTGTITNTLNPSTWITVNKVWKDNDNEFQERPETVDFYLYYRETDQTDWTPYPDGRLTLKQDNAKPGDENTWTGQYNNLPVYALDGKTPLQYTVMEIEGDTPLKQGDKLDGKMQKDLYTVTYQDGHIDEVGTWEDYPAQPDKETLNLTVTNTYGVNLKVVKDWKGAVPAADTEIYVGLYKSGKPFQNKYLKLSADNWTNSFEYLPLGSDYSVKELRPVKEGETAEFAISISGTEVKCIGAGEGEQIAFDGGRTYTVAYSDLTGDTITITNQEIWRLVKRSSSSTEDSPIYLPEAVFDLKYEDGTTFTGTSDAKGIVTWKIGETDFNGTFPDGEYTLTETAAPAGYELGNSITFTVTNGVPENLGSGNTGTVEEGILTFYYDNDALYSLPSSGGKGIQWYIISGILLLMAGSLILYKTRSREF